MRHQDNMSSKELAIYSRMKFPIAGKVSDWNLWETLLLGASTIEKPIKETKKQ